jgi:outer membrane protein OmpA-like peptidoglycan-associated protein
MHEQEKLRAEIELILAQKRKTDLEREQLEKEASKEWHQKERNIQAIIAGIIAVPTFVFFFTYIIEPSFKKDIIAAELELAIKDSTLAQSARENEITSKSLKREQLRVSSKEDSLELAWGKVNEQDRELKEKEEELIQNRKSYEADLATLNQEKNKLQKDRDYLKNSNDILFFDRNIQLTNSFESFKKNGEMPFNPTIYFPAEYISDISKEDKRYLKLIAELLQENQGYSLRIIGHTSSAGSYSYNNALSIRRAKAAKNYLVNDYNINERRLILEGRGELEIISKVNGLNDRVEFAFFKTP